MKIVLVYDRVNRWGGAERVLLALHEIFPDAPLYTSVYSPEKNLWAKVFPQIIPSFLNQVKYLRTRNQIIPYLMPIAFESFRFDNFDLVISVSSEAAKGIITKPKTLHICYCLTPTRYLWSHYEFYFRGPALKAITKPLVAYLRKWDKIAAQRPDVMIGISTAVQQRIKKYYERESELIYPPVDVDKFKNPLAGRAGQNSNSKVKNNNLKFKEYYLVVSRLVPYKKIDLAIEAFNELGLPLVVVGKGSEGKKLKSIAKDNIEFLDLVPDSELISLYKEAKAFIFPQEEDFGITAVEAQAAGCPVIAYRGGGALDTVIENKTGIFFGEQTKKSLVAAVKRFKGLDFKKEDLIDNSERFSKKIFQNKFLDLINH
ncbi:hypothetical protein A2955_03065 [Candidatus Woesebacteria bacterium RIFCSPLOWO2_01_FULL_37_19]|uniref:Glycosyl transferase family 1 domain-containing protein n=1 Tax=Candidatus Woesebacteria bacterium RIFCSPLOWO2_01_FULL_37_19 TaxID=1802514 RepID=A0A1F8B9P8_9BACT|nr:MAG: hypothetical protein A2955_03065 [Candidatus Woesebacteria bacterium RIFCSPLOWO2_01_FULL_37_19]